MSDEGVSVADIVVSELRVTGGVINILTLMGKLAADLMRTVHIGNP